VVPTPLKNISQNETLPQIGVKIKIFETITQIVSKSHIFPNTSRPLPRPARLDLSPHVSPTNQKGETIPPESLPKLAGPEVFLEKLKAQLAQLILQFIGNCKIGYPVGV